MIAMGTVDACRPALAWLGNETQILQLVITQINSGKTQVCFGRFVTLTTGIFLASLVPLPAQ
jgi:hypothetical protein